MSPVLIIGCGIAGPVLAILLHNKGYQPIVFDKVPTLGDAGASLLLMPNGMKVLNLLGIADELQQELPTLSGFWHGDASGNCLGESDIASTFDMKYGQPAVGVPRTKLNLRLKQMLLERGIKVYEGWELAKFEENATGVKAFFSNGQSVEGSFLIGCDGIKATSRRVLLEKYGVHEGCPFFRGLTQTAGISATPATLGKRRNYACNWYGEGMHVIAYPVSATQTSWAITLPAAHEEPETWRLSSTEVLETRRQMLEERVDGFEPAVRELIQTAQRLMQFGLYDRAELNIEHWHSSRCVLVGDAAHPTSPHLGQGANQALEDCYHLSQLLPDIQDCEEKGLLDIFRAFAEKRQPRTSALVKEARMIGEQRVVMEAERCRQRDAKIAAVWSDAEAVAYNYDRLLKEPFL